MRVFILNTTYPALLGPLYRKDTGLGDRDYATQAAVLEQEFVGESPSYARAFRALGHEAFAASANNPAAQRAWAFEHGLPDTARRVSTATLAGGRRGRRVRERLSRTATQRALIEVVTAQIGAFAPDVLLNQDMYLTDASIFAAARASGAMIVGQHAASPLPPTVRLADYDILVSSFPPTVERFRRAGSTAFLSRLAFDPAVNRALEQRPRVARVGVCFVGSLQPIHRSRLEFLEELAQHVPDLGVWTPDDAAVARRSPLRERLHAPVAGVEMYNVLRSSRATINHHGDIAPFANNVRLFEATGVGAFLVTDRKQNLQDLFEPEVDVMAYGSVEECVQILSDTPPARREAVAASGQRRTLREHTYTERATELVGIFGGHR